MSRYFYSPTINAASGNQHRSTGIGTQFSPSMGSIGLDFLGVSVGPTENGPPASLVVETARPSAPARSSAPSCSPDPSAQTSWNAWALRRGKTGLCQEPWTPQTDVRAVRHQREAAELLDCHECYTNCLLPLVVESWFSSATHRVCRIDQSNKFHPWYHWYV